MTHRRLIRKLLIANRGEIACRIIRTCREMGIAVVAVYSDADARALHVELADEAVHIGASPAAESYLNSAKIIAAAQRTRADAVHPGFGFLAENAAFASDVVAADLVFIGPPVSAIEAMGRKREAKRMLKGIPLVPGYSGDDQSDAVLIAAADEIGYPVMIKASAGGGGKGMRRVDAPGEMPEALAAARRESQQAFGDPTLLLEKFITNPRHVEFQIFGDQHGNVLALGERECSIQRRHQKIIEESPSTALTPQLRESMAAAAVSIGQQLGYYSAGTVEFLVDRDGNFYFMEMNTRLQVEHPVTEERFRTDLVRWQIAVAEGSPLSSLEAYFAAHNPGAGRHAIEARVYAEDPSTGFLPVTGRILRWHLPKPRSPQETRIDSGVRSGDDISIHYDPMIAKVIECGPTREDAIRKLDYTLSQLQLLGIRSNIAFLRRVLTHPDHLAGTISTQFIDEHMELLKDTDDLPPTALIAAALAQQQRISPASSLVQWRNNPNRPIRQRFRHNETEFDVWISAYHDDKCKIQILQNIYSVSFSSHSDDEMSLVVDGHRISAVAVADGDTWWVHTGGNVYCLEWISHLPSPGTIRSTAGSLRAPMPGQIINIRVESGQRVARGDILLTLEAMKMEHRIQAPYDGIVEVIHFRVGDSVQADQILLELNAHEGEIQ